MWASGIIRLCMRFRKIVLSKGGNAVVLEAENQADSVCLLMLLNVLILCFLLLTLILRLTKKWDFTIDFQFHE